MSFLEGEGKVEKLVGLVTVDGDLDPCHPPAAPDGSADSP
jgi:hypothetical protein